MSLSKKFTSGLFWNFIGKIIIGLFGAIISILIARKLGKADLGLYATIISISATLRLFTSFGFETILNIKLPSLQTVGKAKEKMRYLIRKFLFYRIGIIFLIAVILYLAEPLLKGFFKEVDFSRYLPLITLYLFTLMIFSYITMIFRALLKIKFVSILEGINQLINLLFLILFFLIGFRVAGVLNAFIISTTISIFILVLLGKDYIFGNTVSIKIKESYEIGLAAALSSFITFGLGTQADVIIMNGFGVPKEEIGLYFLCFSLISMMSFPLQGIGALSQSVFSEIYTREGSSGLALSWSMVTKIVVLLLIPIYIFAIFNANIIIELLYGNRFSAATAYFKIFAIFHSIRILVGSSFCTPVFYLIQRKALALKIQFFGGILNIVLNIILIPKYGVWGVVVATGFSQSLNGVIGMLFVRYHIKTEFPLTFDLNILLACFVALWPAVLIDGSSFISLILKVMVYGTVFIVMLFLLKPLDDKARDFAKNIDNRIFALAKFF